MHWRASEDEFRLSLPSQRCFAVHRYAIYHFIKGFDVHTYSHISTMVDHVLAGCKVFQLARVGSLSSSRVQVTMYSMIRKR